MGQVREMVHRRLAGFDEAKSDLDKLLAFAVKDEQEAIEFYSEKLISALDPSAQEIVRGILADEKRHKQLLQNIQKGQRGEQG